MDAHVYPGNQIPSFLVDISSSIPITESQPGFSNVESSSNSQDSTVSLRRSTRTHKTPFYLSSYMCHATILLPTNSVRSYWCNLVQYKFTHKPCSITEPTCYINASKDSL